MRFGGLSAALAVSLFIGTAGGCKLLGRPSSLADAVLSGPAPSFETIRRRVLRPHCTGCHSGGSVDLRSYASVLRLLPDIERTALVERSMPKYRPLPRQARALLRAWIDAGAPLVSPGPDEPEEPLKPEYASIRHHILVPRCLSCHSEGGEVERIPLDTLDAIMDSPLELVIPGNPDESGLVIAVEREDDKRMPPQETGPPLSVEELSAIREWIQGITASERPL